MAVQAEFVGQAHPQAHEIRLPALLELRQSLQQQARAGQPLPVGSRRALEATASAADTAALLRWQTHADGSQTAVLRFVAEGAHGLRLGLHINTLPAGSALRFYNAQGQRHAELSAEAWAAQQARLLAQGVSAEQALWFWSPDSGDAQSSLEVWLPAGQTPQALQLSVPALSHIAWAQAEDAPQIQARAGDCMVDAVCRPEASAQSRAVARLRYISGGNAYECSGTLLNDSANSGTAHFLTAYHCVHSAEVAATVESTWFYRSNRCDGPLTDRNSRSLSQGATLLFAHQPSDSSLLQLHGSLPAGVLYSGSYFGTPSLSAAHSLHHPNGGLLKYSRGSIAGYANCVDSSGNGTYTCYSAEPENGEQFYTHWAEGVTAQGSSGGALLRQFDGQDHVIGQLLGGSSSCSNPNGRDYFGRFDRAMQAGMKTWLLRP